MPKNDAKKSNTKYNTKYLFSGKKLFLTIIFLLLANFIIKLNASKNSTKICNILETLSGTPKKLSLYVNTKNNNGSNIIDQI